jgi:hypothetical protein
MSIQHREFASVPKLSARTEAPVALTNLGILCSLPGLIEELDGLVAGGRQGDIDQEEQIRNLRVEFGFEPDDVPTAHLRPFKFAAL